MTLILNDSAALPRLNTPTIHRLSNGLTIIAEQMPVEAVNLSLWLGVGSVLESDDINGMAHFLEHMIFKGTERLQSGEFERLIEQRGAVTNAATSQDYTHYHITTAPQDFAELAPLQIEVVLNAAIPDEAFERERFVILEEIRRSLDNPRRRTFYRSMEAAFETLPYRRPVLGLSEIIEQLTPQQMQDFHKTWYQPQSITAVAVGGLPVEELIQTVIKGFEAACPHEVTVPASIETRFTHAASLALEPAFDRIHRQKFTDSSLQQARLIMMWRVPGMSDVQQTYPLDIVAYVLGHGRTARLFQDLREQRGLVSRISVSNMTYARQGVFYITAQMPTENLELVEQAIVEHIQKLHVEPVTDAEIDRVRTLVANHYVFGNETPGNRSGLYGYYQTLVGDLTPALNYPARIHALDAVDLQNAARHYLSPEAYGIVIAKP